LESPMVLEELGAARGRSKAGTAAANARWKTRNETNFEPSMTELVSNSKHEQANPASKLVTGTPDKPLKNNDAAMRTHCEHNAVGNAIRLDKSRLDKRYMSDPPLRDESDQASQASREVSEEGYENPPCQNFKELWTMATPLMRRRSSQKKARDQYRKAIKRYSHQQMLDGLQAYINSDDVQNGLAQQALDRWLRDERFATAVEDDSENIWDERVAISLRMGLVWRDEWGPRPDQEGCEAPTRHQKQWMDAKEGMQNDQ